MPLRTIEQFEQLIRRDPANRGLIASEATEGPLCPGHLAAAAAHLAAHAAHVGLVTGFYVPRGDPPAAETDGPPGTLLLARALSSLGIEVTLLTDELCIHAVKAAADASGFDADALVVYPHDAPDWRRAFYTTGPGRRFTHLVSIERSGPSHTPESLALQQRRTPPPLEQFVSLVPAASHNRCHNMLGEVIDELTPDAWRLFEELRHFRPEAKTIGIGDGGNEIGMGSIPWEELHRRLTGTHAALIPCRVPADWTIIAGTSNWGGYALAAAVLLLRDAIDVIADWDDARELEVLNAMVRHGPAVDGITALREPTVDGLPFTTYIQPWLGIRHLLGFD